MHFKHIALILEQMYLNLYLRIQVYQTIIRHKLLFTPISEVPEAEISEDYQFPEDVRVLGKIALGSSDIGNHWLSLISELGTIIIIR